MKFFKTLIVSMVFAPVIAVYGTNSQAADVKEITVAYFREWPMPYEYAKVKGIYDKELGIKVNWRSFDAGTDMTAAMASGDVQISTGLGLPPFVIGTTAGQQLVAVDVSNIYYDNENCVVRSSLGITQKNAKELEGKKVGTPVGNASYYEFLKQMKFLGVDVSKMNIVNMSPPDAAAAFAQGSLDMACGWSGPLRRMLKYGNVLLTGEQKEAAGILVFDVIGVPTRFALEHPDILAKFLKVTDDMNRKWKTDSAEMLPVIAKDAGMNEKDTEETINAFKYPSMEEQLSNKWFGGGAQATFKEVAEFFKKQGDIPTVLESYNSNVDTGPLRAAIKLTPAKK